MMNNKLPQRFLAITFATLLCLTAGCSRSQGLMISDPVCENLSEPLAINTLQPRFSWKNSSNREGASQTAYQILVADDIKKLNEEEATHWNSGKIESSSSVLVAYAGKPLQNGHLLYWKVRAWDDNGNTSPWSKPVRFGIGLLKKDDWSAAYIGFPTEKGFQGSPQLRKTFSIEKAKKKGAFLLHVNSLGYHEVFEYDPNKPVQLLTSTMRHPKTDSKTSRQKVWLFPAVLE